MKTNLDQFYKTDQSMEKDGIWFSFSDDIGFKMKRFGGFNASSVKAAMSKYYKPYARQIKNGMLPPEKEREVMVRTFVESSITDWRGIEIDGEEVDFNPAKCIELLISLPDLADTLIEYATSFEHFKVDLGNS
jgi:hypothetical protein